jgi:CHAT domain-containing protein/tetratricopeptide (TPR) repeat protein
VLRSFFIHGFVPLLFFTGATPHIPQAPPQEYGSACPSTAEHVADLMRDAQALVANRGSDAGLHCYARAAMRAAAEKDPAGEAEARVQLARAAYSRSNYQLAGQSALAAARLFQSIDDRGSAAKSTRLAGSAALMRGDRAEARRHYEAALEVFTVLGMNRERATTLTDLSGTLSADPVRRDAMLEEALAIARQMGDPELEGKALHHRSDRKFSAGLFDAAIADLTLAIARLEKSDARAALANAYVSLGRILRAHGRAADALEYYDRAGVIMEALGDLPGFIQSLNAKAIALGHLKRTAESRAAYERALELAKQTGSPRLINFQQGNLAAAFAASGDTRGAIRLLEDVLTRETDPYILAYRHGALAQNYSDLGQYEQSVRHGAKSVEYAKSSGNRDYLPSAVYHHARALRALGRTDAALAAARESVDLMEQLRARLVPLDFMKRGFGEISQNVFSLTIALLDARGEHGEALAIGEQARSRAFLDLLASREVGAAPAPETAALVSPRGRAALSSHASAKPASGSDIAATAARIDASILSFWVSEKETFVWVASPDGAVNAARIDVGQKDLEKLVSAAVPSARAGGTDALTRLHRLLIRPVRTHLPPAGSSLAIVPHGPLFRLSFAALLDEQGKYFIEHHAITYAPSISTLLLTAGRAPRTPRRDGYLLIADPSPLPAAGQPLPALPASRREASSIAQVVGRTHAAVLAGPDAGEVPVRTRIAAARVLHFATHGVIRDDEPFDSFLALGRTGPDAGSDGRLTVREIYDLSIPAELVVLSACRTATGPLSGDGITGLTRALFYAGSPTVIATLWDVADEPSARLMSAFYRHWRAGMDKRRALRQAQLDLLRDLRAGVVRIRTRAGVVPLTEQPFYWAAYVLMGEP